jgi:hypothetical protein
MPYIDNVITFCGFSFIEAMLEPHAREVALMSGTEISNVFVIIGAVYLVFSIIAGQVSEAKYFHSYG